MKNTALALTLSIVPVVAGAGTWEISVTKDDFTDKKSTSAYIEGSRNSLLSFVCSDTEGEKQFALAFKVNEYLGDGVREVTTRMEGQPAQTSEWYYSKSGSGVAIAFSEEAIRLAKEILASDKYQFMVRLVNWKGQNVDRDFRVFNNKGKIRGAAKACGIMLEGEG